MTITFNGIVPTLRIFSVDKAKEFYVDFLGFTIDWEHSFDGNFPLYLQISRQGVVLHLSEHHGDCAPGALIIINMTGIDELRADLIAKNYKYAKPGIEDMPWGARIMKIADPFGNRLNFSEEKQS
jgi:catechol 2,3-dioxygenase-like lactoylglutathione lyase family enzyme